MSLIATAVKHLLAAGVTGDALVAAIAEMEAHNVTPEPARDAAAERRREWDRNRRREERAAAKAALSTVSTGCPVDFADNADATPFLDKERSPRPPKENNPIPVCDGALRARRLPTDWKPSKPLPQPVADLMGQWPPGRSDRELDGFRDYWVARTKDATRADWDRVWWNRIRDQHDRIMRENRNGNRPHHDRSGGWAPRPGMEGVEPASLDDDDPRYGARH